MVFGRPTSAQQALVLGLDPVRDALTRRLESDMLAAGQRLVRVPPQLMATARRSSRERGKSDPIDALAVARAALREPDLPLAELDGPTRELRLLVDHRASRFKSKDAFARFNGTAPVPVWSANTGKVRLNRGGNRQVNTALHLIAVTQLRGVGPGQAYVAKRIAAGDDKTEALRLLRRRLSDVVYRAMLADERARQARLERELAVAA